MAFRLRLSSRVRSRRCATKTTKRAPCFRVVVVCLPVWAEACLRFFLKLNNNTKEAWHPFPHLLGSSAKIFHLRRGGKLEPHPQTLFRRACLIPAVIDLAHCRDYGSGHGKGLRLPENRFHLPGRIVNLRIDLRWGHFRHGQAAYSNPHPVQVRTKDRHFSGFSYANGLRIRWNRDVRLQHPAGSGIAELTGYIREQGYASLEPPLGGRIAGNHEAAVLRRKA